jgi:VWFA-related protein
MWHRAVFLMFVAVMAAEAATLALQSPPTFKTGVDVVRMDVRITGADGLPIKDLRAEEVIVDDEGQRAPVVLLQHIEEPAGTYDDVARRTISSEVSTNQGAPRGHLYLIVFDQQHIAPGNEGRARVAAARFLKTRVRPGDRVAVYAIPGPGPQSNFTTDVDKVIAELPTVRGGLERTGLTGMGSMSVDEAYQIVRGDQFVLADVVGRLSAESAATDLGGSPQARAGNADSASDNNVFVRAVKENARTVVAKADGDARRFLLLLTRLMREMRGIEGRKAVVLLSEGFYSDHVARELEDAAAAAAQSYSVVYSLDLNRRGPSPTDAAPRGASQQREEQSRIEPLGTLAAETDGRLFLDAGVRLDRVFESIADESQDYYIVGFTPSGVLNDRSKYRRVTIRVSRRGARVSTRTGYTLQLPDPSPAARRRQIDTAFAAPFPEQGLPVEVTTYERRGSAPGASTIVLTVAAEIPIGPLKRNGATDVVFVVQQARTGRVVAGGTDTLKLPETGQNEAASVSGICRVQFETPPGEYIARVVVREPGGLVGSADRRFDVRDLDGPDLTASDLVVGSLHDPLPVRLRTTAADVLTGTLEIYGRTAEQLRDIDVRVELSSIGGSAPVMVAHADLLDAQQDDRGASRVALIALPLANVAAGRYAVRAAVQAAGTIRSEATREVEIATDLPPTATAARLRDGSFEPEALLDGDVVRRYLATVRRAAPTLARAVDLAAAGSWNRVEEVVGLNASTAGVRGLARLSRRDYEAAATLFVTALEHDERSAALAFFLGWAHSARGNLPQAISAWRRTTFVDATLVPAHLALADAYVQLGQRALAIQAVRAGLTALPASPELIDKLARLEAR